MTVRQIQILQSGEIINIMENQDRKRNAAQAVFKHIYLRPSMIFLLVLLPFTAGYFLGLKYLLPLLTGIPASIVLIIHLRKKRYMTSVMDMILYVFWLSISGLILMYFFPDQADRVILKGISYWEEMRPWLEGQASKEGSWQKFIPEHLLHTVIVGVSSLISAGSLALIFGTILVNYMNFYVSKLMLAADFPILLAFVGWHPWSVIRVIGFIILGCACAAPMVSKIDRHVSLDKRKIILMIIFAVILEITDILLKIFTGPIWRDFIASHINLE